MVVDDSPLACAFVQEGLEALGYEVVCFDDPYKALEQVGEMIGVTKERVRQIQNKALGKLRAALEGAILAA